MSTLRIAGTSFNERRLRAERAQLRENAKRQALRECSRARAPDPGLAAHCAPALKPVKPAEDSEATSLRSGPMQADALIGDATNQAPHVCVLTPDPRGAK